MRTLDSTVPGSDEAARDVAPLVSVVVLTYNRRPLLERCLRQLALQTHPAIETIVVDNASSDGTADLVATCFPAVTLIRNTENLYFTGGMNKGILAAHGEYVLLLTDDVLLEPEYIAKLLPAVTADDAVGLVAGVVYDESTRTVICAGGDIRFGLDLVHIIVNRVAGPDAHGRPLQVVGYVPPTMALARRAVLHAVGLFDDEFKFTSEDVDLVLQMKRQRYAIVVNHAASGYYMKPLSTADRETPTIDFHMQKNLFLLYFKHASLRMLLGFLLYRGAWFTKVWLLSKIDGRQPLRQSTLRAHLWCLTKAPWLIQKRIRLQALSGTREGA